MQAVGLDIECLFPSVLRRGFYCFVHAAELDIRSALSQSVFGEGVPYECVADLNIVWDSLSIRAWCRCSSYASCRLDIRRLFQSEPEKVSLRARCHLDLRRLSQPMLGAGVLSVRAAELALRPVFRSEFGERDPFEKEAELAICRLFRSGFREGVPAEGGA